jgi:hypothetical protein
LFEPTQKRLENSNFGIYRKHSGFLSKDNDQDQMVSVSKDRSGNDKTVATKISDKDWKELVGYFETIELDSLPTLKAPTEKRFHDGAAIANLDVSYKDKKYKTTSFDHGYPPEAIKKLVTKINSFAKEKQ